MRFRWKAKTLEQIAEERQAYEDAARQKSLLDPDLDLIALEPCPYAFHFDWTDADGKTHKATCDDWETAATFYRRQRTMSASDASVSSREVGGYINGRHRAQAMLDTGVRRTLVAYWDGKTAGGGW